MHKRAWKTYRPTSLQDAIEACVDFAREKHQRSVDRIADLMGQPSKWVIYKWMEGATLPAGKVRAFEHACGCTYVTQYLATSAHKLLVDLPVGRTAGPSDVHAVSEACSDAVGALLAFVAGKRTAEECHTALTRALEQLAFERAQVERHTQPELALT